jgi:hypothetical protein
VAYVGFSLLCSLRIAGEGEECEGYQHQWQQTFHFYLQPKRDTVHQYGVVQIAFQTPRVPYLVRVTLIKS